MTSTLEISGAGAGRIDRDASARADHQHRRAHRVAAKLEAGVVWVNGWALMDPAVPFGGVKSSGTGREHGPEALLPYMRTKSVIVSTAHPRQ